MNSSNEINTEKTDIQELLKLQKIEPYYNAIECSVSLTDRALKVRFCFDNNVCPYCFEIIRLESFRNGCIAYIRNLCDVIIASAAYKDDSQCADSLYGCLAKFGIKDKKVKEIVYKLLIGDFPIERFL